MKLCCALKYGASDVGLVVGKAFVAHIGHLRLRHVVSVRKGWRVSLVYDWLLLHGH